jgi:hypothetical protein
MAVPAIISTITKTTPMATRQPTLVDPRRSLGRLNILFPFIAYVY